MIISPCIFSLQSTTLSDYKLQILHTVNNIEVSVNTCTCTDVFTIITTKDQSGGIYNSYSTCGQGFKQTSSLGYSPQTQSVYCHKSLAPVL